MADNLLNSSFRLFIDFQTEAGVSQWGEGLGLQNMIGLYLGCGLILIRLDYHSTITYKEDA